VGLSEMVALFFSHKCYIRMSKKNQNTYITLSLSLFFVLSSCGHDPIPKPRGYFRIDLPEKQYVMLDSIYPYKFSYPVYGRIVQDNSRGTEKYWINIEFRKNNAKIHLSYKRINNNLDELIEDSRNLVDKHIVKADAINEKVFSDVQKKVYGSLFDIKGNAASPYQFYLTDSTRHFLRGALYFQVQPNKDSLTPVIDFFKKDIVYLIESLEWK